MNIEHLRVVPSVVLATGSDGKAQYAQVTQCRLMPADAQRNTHEVPVMPQMPALVFRTDNGGTRFYGVVDGFISARLRMIVEITSLRFEEMAAWEVPHADEVAHLYTT